MNEKRFQISIGMFDFLKGIAILSVIFGHCRDAFDFSSLPRLQTALDCYLFPFFSGTFRCFFIISGFYFRERSVKSTFLSGLKQILKPYLFVFAMSLGIDYFLQNFLNSFNYQSLLQILLAGLFGFWEKDSIFGLDIMSVGPVWYLLASFWCLILLNAVVKLVPEKWQVPAVAFLCVCGYVLSGLRIQLPFCIREAMIYLPYCYYGYLLRKKEWISNIKGKWLWIGLGSAAAITVVFRILFGSGIIAAQQILMTIWAVVLFPVAALWKPKDGILIDVLSFIGRYSFYIFCAHSIDQLTLKTFRQSFVSQYANRPLLGTALLFVEGCAVAAMGCGIVYLRRKIADRKSEELSIGGINREMKVIKNTPGMFDIFKGIMMLAIMMGHSISTFFQYWNVDFSQTPLMFFAGLFISFTAHGAVPVFFMICGYGLRKMTVKSSVKKQLGYLVIPYLLIILAVELATFARIYLRGGSLWERLEYYVVPYLLAYCGSSTTLFGMTVGTIGPFWFVWAYFVGAVVVNLILQNDEIWLQILQITVLSLFGLALREVALPFCIHQIAICSGYLYFGWILKKTKFLQKEIPVRFWWILFAVCLCLSGFGDIEISMNSYDDGATDLLVSYLCGLLFLYLSAKLGSMRGSVWNGIAWLGRKALIICCLHTVSYIALPWKTVAVWLGGQKLLGIVLAFAVHFCFAVGGAMILDLIKKQRAKALRKQ